MQICTKIHLKCDPYRGIGGLTMWRHHWWQGCNFCHRRCTLYWVWSDHYYYKNFCDRSKIKLTCWNLRCLKREISTKRNFIRIFFGLSGLWYVNKSFWEEGQQWGKVLTFTLISTFPPSHSTGHFQPKMLLFQITLMLVVVTMWSGW